MKIIIIFCIISIFTIITTHPIKQDEQQNNQQVHVVTLNEKRYKRDLFASTGWGAGGVSYSTFYITGKQVKEMQAAQNKNSKRNINEPPEENDIKALTMTTKEKQTIPQLFSSNGWGPLG